MFARVSHSPREGKKNTFIFPTSLSPFPLPIKGSDTVFSPLLFRSSIRPDSLFLSLTHSKDSLLDTAVRAKNPVRENVLPGNKEFISGILEVVRRAQSRLLKMILNAVNHLFRFLIMFGICDKIIVKKYLNVVVIDCC